MQSGGWRRSPTTRPSGWSDDLAVRLAELEHQCAQGPGRAAALQETWCFAGDLVGDPRWPRLGSALRLAPARSALSVGLCLDGQVLGSVTMYAATSGTWPQEQVARGLAFATVAATGLGQVRTAAGLREAIESRHAIGVAQGLLMARYDITQEQSFELLRRLSGQHNLKVRDLAAAVVRQKGLPLELGRPDPSRRAATGGA